MEPCSNNNVAPIVDITNVIFELDGIKMVDDICFDKPNRLEYVSILISLVVFTLW
jgi:hypothetical protein